MKRFSKVLLLAAFTAFIAVPQNIFAQTAENQQTESKDESGEYDDDRDYYEDEEARLTPNGAGDQFISLKLMPMFPLNFGDKLYVGGALSLGYHRFLSQYFAVGADVMFGYHPTLGNNMLTIIPITIGVTFQPYVWKFEFPITLDVGMAVESYLQYNYFPGLVLKGSGGVYYRMTESWSFGGECQFMWLPQWYKKLPAEHYLGITANVCARYHF